jgi:septum formation protein
VLETVLILASTSPRRIALLTQAGIAFRPEDPGPDDDAEPAGAVEAVALVERRSREKAAAVAARFPHAVVIGADTVIADGDRLIGKAADRAEAERIIRALCGREHRVLTGVTVIDGRAGRTATRHAESRVRIEPPTETQLTEYLDSGLWRGKSGAYGIQDLDGLDVRLIDGERSNVIGLPMGLLREMLASTAPQGGPPTTEPGGTSW